jgi:hypothetical protein
MREMKLKYANALREEGIIDSEYNVGESVVSEAAQDASQLCNSHEVDNLEAFFIKHNTESLQWFEEASDLTKIGIGK